MGWQHRRRIVQPLDDWSLGRLVAMIVCLSTSVVMMANVMTVRILASLPPVAPRANANQIRLNQIDRIPTCDIIDSAYSQWPTISATPDIRHGRTDRRVNLVALICKEKTGRWRRA